MSEVEPDQKVSDPLLNAAMWLAAVMMLLAVILTVIFPQKAVEPVAGMNGAIIAFEFAQTPDEVLGVFGREDNEARDKRISKMNLGNQIDFLFMLLYSLFFFCYALLLHVRHSAAALYCVCLLTPVMLAGDVMETWSLINIANAVQQGISFDDALATLQVWTWVKWGALAAALLIMAPFSFREGKLGKVLAFVQVCSAALGAWCFFNRSWLSEVFALLVSLSLLLMAVQVILWAKFPLPSQKSV